MVILVSLCQWTQHRKNGNIKIPYLLKCQSMWKIGLQKNFYNPSFIKRINKAHVYSEILPQARLRIHGFAPNPVSFRFRFPPNQVDPCLLNMGQFVKNVERCYRIYKRWEDIWQGNIQKGYR